MHSCVTWHVIFIRFFWWQWKAYCTYIHICGMINIWEYADIPLQDPQRNSQALAPAAARPMNTKFHGFPHRITSYRLFSVTILDQGTMLHDMSLSVKSVKIIYALTTLPMSPSQKIAHPTTTRLLWDVQNVVLISSLLSRQEQRVFLHDFQRM